MKKKVKRIPKYNTGTINTQSLLDLTLGQGTLGTSGYTPTMGSTNANGGSSNGALGIAGGIASAISGASGVVANALDIEQGKNAAIFNVAGDVALMIPGIGQILGPALKTVGAFAGEGGDVDQNTGEINKSSGLTRVLGFGRKDKSLYAESNRIKNAIQAKAHTENIRTDYMNNPNAPGLINLNAAEGGVIPNENITVAVTAGEVYRDSNTGEWGVVKGLGMHSKKPKKDDAETMQIPRGSVILNTHPDYVFKELDNKTTAQFMRPLAKPIKTTGKYSEGTKAAIDAIGKKLLRKQELRKQELHLGEIKNNYSKGTPHVQLGEDPIWKLEETLMTPQTPEIKGKDRRWIYHTSNALKGLSHIAPFISGLFGKNDYHKEEAIISPHKKIPTGYDISDILADNYFANTMNNYNIDQMGPNTGQYLAAKTQSAANLMGANSKARIYQKNKQNELIAKNVGIQNDWNKQFDLARYKAIENTMANEAAAQQMRDQRYKDFLEFYYGKRNDNIKMAMLEPLLNYSIDDGIHNYIKRVA